MSNEERAAAMGQQEVVALLVSHRDLTPRLAEVQQQLDWLTRQLFGAKSERHVALGGGLQLTLVQAPASAPAGTIALPAHQPRQTSAAEADDGDMRFDDTVPVERIVLEPDLPAD